MGMPWFRQYCDFLEDPKMISLAFEDQRHFIAVCALKSLGTLDQECEPTVLDKIVAQKIWVDYAVIDEVKKRLQSVGLIDDNWQPVAWNKRQQKSDTSTERVRRHRQQKQEIEGCNDDETLQKRSSNALDKIREDKNREDNTGQNGKRFTPPTLSEVQAYKQDRNSNVDAERFVDFYESKGWMVGKNKMKDWKAAFRTWERDAKADEKTSDVFGGSI